MKYHQRNRLTSPGTSHSHVILLLVGPNLYFTPAPSQVVWVPLKALQSSYLKILMAGHSILKAIRIPEVSEENEKP